VLTVVIPAAPVYSGEVYRRRSLPGTVEVLAKFPVLAVLDQLPAPVLAVGHRGAILFSNNAFADMLGHKTTALSAMNLRDVMLGLTLAEFVLPFLHAHAGTAVNLIHARGWIFQTQMSASAMLRKGDEVMLSTFVPVPSSIPERRAVARLRR
jgi:hypothetical protein